MSSKDEAGWGRRGYHHGRLKEALLEAARRLAAERGPAGFSLAEAAKFVGVTAAAPYRHFADRDALMQELARRGFEQFAAELEAAWDAGTPDPRAALARMGEAYLAFAQREPGLYAAMFGAARNLDAPEPGAAADRALEALRRAAGATLARAGLAPEAARLRARELGLRIWSMSHGVAMLAVSGHLAPDRAGCATRDILLPGVEALIEAAIASAKATSGTYDKPAPGPSPGPWGRRG